MFILVVILTILILVVIHELGHFLAARKFNIKVLEFGFGLPPRAWGKKVGETLVSLNWLPFGGFVRLLGEDEVDADVLKNERSFAAQPVGKRILVVAAGVLMNLLLAWVLFWLVLWIQDFKVKLPLLIPYQFTGVAQNNETIVMLGEITPNSPAEAAGLKSGEVIAAVNDRFVGDIEDLITQIKTNAGGKVKLTLSDVNKKSYRTVEVTPRVNPPEGQGALGVSLGAFKIANLEYHEPWQKALAGPIHSLNLVTYSWQILSGTIAQSISSKDITPVSRTVSGPVGITSLVKEILEIPNPIVPLLDFIAVLSLNLSLINVLPFPGLDGGRLLFLLIEAATGRRTHPTLEKYVHFIGLLILLALIVLITLSDIRKLIF